MSLFPGIDLPITEISQTEGQKTFMTNIMKKTMLQTENIGTIARNEMRWFFVFFFF